ncbi:MAG: hypothetical protein JST89_18800 [Cyanobacteria bacterium SZAS-4]|nr:hypothetical protein [Cyanobacteria bacterium SZAS-4]
MNKGKILICMVAAVVLLSFGAESRAQYGTQQRIKPAVPLNKLAGPLNLRNIPVYSGAVFRDGCFHAQNAASETYYSLQEKKKIMDWYVDQMDNQGWKIKVKSTNMLLCETSNGDRAKVQVSSLSPTTGYRSSIVLTRCPL